MLILSEKYKDFIKVIAEREYLEGTTAAGKTTVGIFKFMIRVSGSQKKYHVIAGADIGTVEKNVINAERGLLDQFEGLAEYHGSGKGKIRLPHIEYETIDGSKIIYICGYDNKKRWQKVLGGQVGCVYIDEVNIADMEFLREVSHRCEYMLTTSNPDSPDLAVYEEFINRSRPLERYVKDYPEELIEELKEPKEDGWIHWYFTFRDNAALTDDEVERKIRAVAPGTKMYRNKILGLRGRATGLVFSVDDNSYISKAELKSMCESGKVKFKRYSCGIDTSYSQKSDDSIALAFGGITVEGEYIALKCEAYNNRDLVVPLTPSSMPELIVKFLESCRKEWGFGKNVYIDSADQATILECKKYKRKKGTPYEFVGAFKQTGIIDRINLQCGWIASGKYKIVKEDCKPYIAEINSYSWRDDKDMPEDGNDHTINAFQYAWLPYKSEIG